MKRFVIDGVKEVALRHPTADDLEAGEQKLDECTFEQAEVYAVDVAMSTGDGRPRPGVLRTTVFKRNVEANYRLKMKNSRSLLQQVDKKFPTLPFTLAHFEDERNKGGDRLEWYYYNTTINLMSAKAALSIIK